MKLGKNQGAGPGKRVKLIYNPLAGAARKPRPELADVVCELQRMDYDPVTWLVEPGCSITEEVQNALAEGVRLFVACGGDGTITAVAGKLIGTDATLVIIPTGTQNNIAKSLGISESIPSAVQNLTKGKRIRIDVGMAFCQNRSTHFMEICSVGLVSALSPAGDAIQHGDVASVGAFLSTLISSEPSEIELTMDDGKCLTDRGHIILATNMPYVGFHYQMGPAGCHRDGLLNVIYFADLSKVDLIKYIARGIYVGKPEDERIQHFKVRKAKIHTNPPMPVMVDGTVIGEGLVRVEVRQRALSVMVPR